LVGLELRFKTNPTPRGWPDFCVPDSLQCIVAAPMQLTLTHKTHLADNVWSFQFAPQHPVSWLAGQFVEITIPHEHPDTGGVSRRFTICAAPYEQAITITTRITKTTFKQALHALPVGGHVTLAQQPAGDFLWLGADRPHIFAAQGIGITPFYAIIKDRIHRGLPVQATLVYAHQPGMAAIFEGDFTAWAHLDPTLTVIADTGTLTAARLAELAPDYAQRIVYASGPKSFISLCMPPHNLPISHLKQDNFPGYAAANY
jgi:ferredoxin-NADP reductase